MDNAISIFALPFLFINKRKGMIVIPFSLTFDSILLSSSLFNNNFLSLFGVWLFKPAFCSSPICKFFIYSSELLKVQKASERLALLFLIDFISVPNKAIPAVYFVRI